MLILTEKSSVARDFALALDCHQKGAVYSGGNIVITYCQGHLFGLHEPNHYSAEYYVFPDKFEYFIKSETKKQAELVIDLIKKNYKTSILIATDADREGEVIARECLLMAGVSDISRIKRFWVSQALTRQVIVDGIKNARPLADYNGLADQGFARQHADWLVGINCSRYIKSVVNARVSVGRVQTALLNAISLRNEEIENFKKEKYFEHYGIFDRSGNSVTAIYCEKNKTSFPDDSLKNNLQQFVGKKFSLKDKSIENKTLPPPQLYNLTALQKDAYNQFSYTAETTLAILQELYEDLKCVSYPRTPSRVMGSGNTELCLDVFETICRQNPMFSELSTSEDFSIENKRCFNDKKLEAHHALIPLKVLPSHATEQQKNIYSLILERFLVAFLPENKYEKQIFLLSSGDITFKVSGKKNLFPGWKQFSKFFSQKNMDEKEEQSLDGMDWNNAVLLSVETKEKWTAPPKMFNESSILAFMENPRKDTEEKLTGLGTAATRHTFIPALKKNGYISNESEKFIVSQKGKELLKVIKSSPVEPVADISTTTQWEEKLAKNPKEFEKEIQAFLQKSITQKTNGNFDTSKFDSGNKISCPMCGKHLREGSKNWYCTGYFDKSCSFSLWKSSHGATFSEADITALCSGSKTKTKKCRKKDGGEYQCAFVLNHENWKIESIFQKEK